MSEEVHFLRAQTLSMKSTRSASPDEVLKRVMRHNLREVHSEFGERAGSKVDPRRIHLNETLFGLSTANGVAGVAHEAMLAAGASQRANAALGIEIVFSLPKGLTIDYRAYFTAAMQWARQHFDVPMLSAVIHNDEDYPHAHIVMLPMRDGKLMGRNILGGRAETKAMHKSFHVEVGKRYGLSAPKPPKRHSAEVRHIAMQVAREYMREISGFTDAKVDALVRILAKDPEATMAALGLPMPTEPSETVAGIFTRDCGRDNAIALCEDEPESAIALCDDDESGRNCGENQKRYALDSAFNSPPSFPPPNEPQPTSASTPEPAFTTANTCATTASAADTEPQQANQPDDAEDTEDTADRYTRERDADHHADQWDTDSGEWIVPKPARASHKAIAAESVLMALGSIGKAPRPPQRPQARCPMQC